MSILTEVLQEELDRCHRRQAACLAQLQELDLSMEGRERLQASIQQANEDIFRIERALAPVLPQGDSPESYLKQAYQVARTIGFGQALQLAREASSEEERNFFAFIANMNLQRAQWDYIRNVELLLYQERSDDEHRPPLTPSPDGKECLANGKWPGYECECPDCDYYETVCFPDWEGHRE